MRAPWIIYPAFGLVVGCAAGPERFAEGTTSTAEMLERAAAEVDHRAIFVGEYAVAERIEATIAAGDGDFEARMRLALSHMRVGRTEDALSIYEALETTDDLAARRLDRAWTVAQFRLAEQRNCVALHNCDSCVYPIVREAEHCEPDAARAAAAGWRRVLAHEPDSVTARWLYSLAHMTLGQYPDHVAPRWRADVPVDDRVAGLDPLRDRAAELGVDVTGVSGGCVFDDLDGDGDLDLLASAIYPIGESEGQLRFFRNRGDGSGFDDATTGSGLEGITGGLNLVHGDYDNDGDLDVFVLRGAWQQENGRWPNTLLRNRGDGSFEDVTVAAGVLAFEPTQVGAWGDYDGDGWLDLFVGNETAVPAIMEDDISQWFADLFIGIDYSLGSTVPGHLYRNNRDGTFTDVVAESGIELYGWIKGASWGDYDSDGDVDLFVSRFGKVDQLWRNRGDGTFEDATEIAGVGGQLLSFASWFWDFDDDGHLDVFVAGYPYPEFEFPDDGPIEVRWSPEAELVELLGGRIADPKIARSRLWRNQGDGTFVDVAGEMGLDAVMSIMGANFEDVDGDGALDVFLGTGAPDYEYLVPNRLFLQRDGRFVDASLPLRASHLQKGHGIGFGDHDGDGDPDAYVVLGGAYVADSFPNSLLENPGFGNRWVTLCFEGTVGNRSAIGARVAVEVEHADGTRRTLHRVVGSGGSFGASSLQQEVGIGDGRVVGVRVRWPGRDGVQQDFDGAELEAGGRYLLREGFDAPIGG